MAELLPRGVVSHLIELLDAVSVVVIEGPRASGKTALGQLLHEARRLATVADLSDPTVLEAALNSPSTFVEGLRTPALIDEAQLAPDILLAIKRRVDADPRPGSFILTGSSPLGRAQLGGTDPLAGRSARVRLWPMTQGELIGSPVDRMAAITTGRLPPDPFPRLGRAELIDRIQRGGLPTLAGITATVTPSLRPYLVSEYVEAVLYHETGRRHDRAELARTLRFLAASTARLLNVSNVANELATTRDTVISRLATLEASFLVHSVRASRPAEHRSLTAHPKIHAVDTAIAAWAARLGDDPAPGLFGAMVETFVVNELSAQADWSRGWTVRQWRDTSRKLEVDAVLIDSAGRPTPIEVKAGSDVRSDDLRGLRGFLDATPTAERGIVFYTGEHVLALEPRIWAVPIAALWHGL